MNTPLPRRLEEWINKRFPAKAIMDWCLNEEIPGGASFFYTLGSLTLFLFMIQVLTGVWQMLYYTPTVDHAYESVNYLRSEIPFGWLIHGLHYWGANAFSVVIVLHVFRVFIWGAYKRPREMVWLSGVFLLLMAGGFMFTGPVLPWDKVGYWAGEVGLSMAANVPVLGTLMQYLLQGSGKFGQLALTRLYTLHIIVLPALAFLFIGIHLVAFRQFGSVGPWNEDGRKEQGAFWPDQIYKDIVVVSLMLFLLVGLTAFVPAPFNGAADPLDSSIVPKPEWNFLFLYEILKYFKGSLEPIGIVGVPMVIILLFTSLPFMDRSEERDPLKRPFVMVAGILFTILILVFTLKGCYSNPAEAQDVQTEAQKDPADPPAPKLEAGPGDGAGLKKENISKGRDVFEAEGCMGCHTVDGRPSNKVGPDLLLSLTPAQSRDWLHVQVVDPKAHNPYTIMPAYDYLIKEKVDVLLDFLQYVSRMRPNVETPWTAPQAGRLVPAGKKPGTAAPEEPRQNAKEDTAALSAAAEHGRQLFETVGCTVCHTATGQAQTKSGPDIVSALRGQDKSKDWLDTQLIFPEKHVPDTIMPSYKYLGEANLAALVEFLYELQKEKPASQVNAGAVVRSAPGPAKAPTGAPEAPRPAAEEAKKGFGRAVTIVGDRQHGERLYKDFCYQCHGPEGRANAQGFNGFRGVPPLNPIAEDVFDPDPAAFVKKIDPVIQHGRPNPGNGPEMPAFGDENSLTQPQIADIEAYVLKINNVDRGHIDNPGIPPKDFFYILLEIFIVLVVLLAIYWWIKKILDQ